LKEPLTGESPSWWQAGFQSLEREHVPGIELELFGTIPVELSGTLYRNGPARFDVYGQRLEHWFDGDGMVHAFRLAPDKVEYCNRFVESAGFREERAAKRRLYGRFMTPPAGGPLGRLRRRTRGKTSQNTSVHMHAGTLLALSESGWPMRLDPVTLQSLGEDDLGGLLQPGEGYSAHPRFDAGEMWNFTSLYGSEPRTRILRRDCGGRCSVAAELVMPMPSMIHDFALTPHYAIVEYDPFILPRVPAGLILGQRSFGQSLRWHPSRGSKLALLPRDGSQATLTDIMARLAVHVIHAFEDNGSVVVDALSYGNADIIQAYREVMTGPIQTGAWSYPERFRWRPSGPPSVKRLSDIPLELPAHLAPVGVPHRIVWGVAWSDPRQLPRIPARLDVEDGTTVLAPMQPFEFAGECVPVRKRGARGDADAWLLTVVLDARSGRSELRVLDGADLSTPAVAVAKLPHAIPLGFHGTFVSDA
jgi:all-trans-8'-apo-beta-carotenal 15,15'-oxygenase